MSCAFLICCFKLFYLTYYSWLRVSVDVTVMFQTSWFSSSGSPNYTYIGFSLPIFYICHLFLNYFLSLLFLKSCLSQGLIYCLFTVVFFLNTFGLFLKWLFLLFLYFSWVLAYLWISNSDLYCSFIIICFASFWNSRCISQCSHRETEPF